MRDLKLWLAVFIFCIAGALLVSQSYGSTAITWMYVFEAKDVVGWAGFIDFYQNLRIAVPPFWSVLDILSYQVFGDYRINAIWLYRIAMVGSFLLPGLIFKLNWPHRILSLAIGLYFLATSVQIHPGNPGIVDFYFASLSLIFYWGVTELNRSKFGHRKQILFAFSMGFVFSMIELTRPFIIYMSPFIFIGIFLALRKLNWKALVAIAFPILMLSGGWHAHHWINFNQVAWTNHSGINLMRAWDPVMGDWQSLVEPEEPPIEVGRMNNINTEVHSRNSNLMKEMVIHGIIDHPKTALTEATWNLKVLLDGKTCLMRRCPEHWILKPYKAVVRIALGLFGLGFLTTLIRLSLDKQNRVQLISMPETQLMGFTVLSILLLAFGDKGEDARFLISVLPLISVFPGLQNVKWAFNRLKGSSEGQVS